jgi:type I restriction enzyme S subunit
LGQRIGGRAYGTVNHNLEQTAQSLFERLLIEDCADEPHGVLADIAFINPSRSLSRGQAAVYVEMANLPTRGSFPSNWDIRPFAGGLKFTNGDTIMARITPCLENGKTAFINFLDDGDVAFGSTEYIIIAPKPGYCSEMFYFLARYPDFVSYAVGNMNGSSGRQRVSGETIGQYELSIPPPNKVREFAEVAAPIMDSIRQNALDSHKLAQLRDTLLPKLMSGELSIGDG